ncbi:HNH endonuclease signature motif containing protein [Kribbella sp. NPDC026611]|uniref:HNH endonuclease signature motif containing protein n=1 Tax=Kribbella sp. NPDC026611 TaxID=3154911 RepID=UPI003407787B
MPPKKKRTAIPRAVAAKVLFESDRHCCVCRESGKKVQIHHINEDPSDHTPANLAPLCFDCHDLTQAVGGFGRKLDADQVVMYRDQWVDFVAQQRGAGVSSSDLKSGVNVSLEMATSLAEIYRENNQLMLLIMHYHSIGNIELRDKWIDRALAGGDVSDEDVIFFRGLQARPDLVPDEVAQRRLDVQEQHADWSQRARTLRSLQRWPEAARDYLKAVMESLDEGQLFSAAYYLKELSKSKIHEQLFIQSYAADTNLWWRVRALQELGWDDELRDLVLANAAEIEAHGTPLLRLQLDIARGDLAAYRERRKDIARTTRQNAEWSHRGRGAG